jgi:hypothetical protein
MKSHLATAQGSPLSGAFFVAAADELEEEVGGIRLERQVAELVDDQQPRFGEARQTLVQPLLGVRLGEGGHECRRGDELHGVAGQDGPARER